MHKLKIVSHANFNCSVGYPLISQAVALSVSGWWGCRQMGYNWGIRTCWPPVILCREWLFWWSWCEHTNTKLITVLINVDAEKKYYFSPPGLGILIYFLGEKLHTKIYSFFFSSLESNCLLVIYLLLIIYTLLTCIFEHHIFNCWYNCFVLLQSDAVICPGK